MLPNRERVSLKRRVVCELKERRGGPEYVSRQARLVLLQVMLAIDESVAEFLRTKLKAFSWTVTIADCVGVDRAIE